MIRTHLDDAGVLTVLLDKPAKLNCLDFEDLDGLDEAIDRAATQPAVRLLSVRGAGERAFSTGADLKVFNSLRGPDVERWIRRGHTVFSALEALPKPTVAVLRGYVLGGGLELALACDFRLAAPGLKIGAVEVANGWLPGWGGLHRLARLLGEASAKRVILSAELLSDEEMRTMGLVSKWLPDGDATDAIDAFLQHLTSLDAATYAQAKHVLTGPPPPPHAIDYDVMAAHRSLERKNAQR